MSIPCVTQARVFAPRRGPKEELPTVASSWSLPVWICPMESASKHMFEGVDNPEVLLHSRIATPLGIEDGDSVLFELVECGERFKREVTVSSDIQADFVIHDALSTEIAVRAAVSSKTRKGITTTTTTLGLVNKRELKLPGQELWANTKVSSLKGSGILHFDGASRTSGSAGFGFSISSASNSNNNIGEDDSPIVGSDLVNGYCFCGSGTNAEMEYAGLLEALEWALRFDFERLWIRGDSELVIQQVSGNVEVKEDQLVEYFYYTKIQALLDKAEERGTDVVLEPVPKEANVIANVLANLAIDLKENATACNWDSINEQCRRPTK